MTKTLLLSIFIVASLLWGLVMTIALVWLIINYRRRVDVSINNDEVFTTVIKQHSAAINDINDTIKSNKDDNTFIQTQLRESLDKATGRLVELQGKISSTEVANTALSKEMVELNNKINNIQAIVNFLKK